VRSPPPPTNSFFFFSGPFLSLPPYGCRRPLISPALDLQLHCGASPRLIPFSRSDNLFRPTFPYHGPPLLNSFFLCSHIPSPCLGLTEIPHKVFTKFFFFFQFPLPQVPRFVSPCYPSNSYARQPVLLSFLSPSSGGYSLHCPLFPVSFH